MERNSKEPTRTARPGEEIDVERLTSYLESRVADLRRPIEVRQFRGGHSNLTYLLRSGASEYVLRRPPFGAEHIKSGHDMSREHRILSALAPIYPRAPRPVLFVPQDESPIAAPFYVMERVRGVILRPNETPADELTAARMRDISGALIDGLVELHSVDFASIGLDTIGRPDGYVERQVAGWRDRYQRAATADLPEMAAIAEWLDANVPLPQRAALLHNDYKYDNIVLDPDDLTRIVAVLDWEMATIGDPLADLGTTLAYWIVSNDPAELRGLGFGVTTLPGNLSRSEIIDRYARATGLDVSSMLFYYTLALFKVAVIAQQLFYRLDAGFTTDRRFARMGDAVRVLAYTGARAIRDGRVD